MFLRASGQRPCHPLDPNQNTKLKTSKPPTHEPANSDIQASPTGDPIEIVSYIQGGPTWGEWGKGLWDSYGDPHRVPHGVPHMDPHRGPHVAIGIPWETPTGIPIGISIGTTTGIHIGI